MFLNSLILTHGPYLILLTSYIITCLLGPIEVADAMPGDLLKVELLNLGSLDGDEWGFTGTFAQVSVLSDLYSIYM